ncbi:pantetheine-phosphate adenylyltransferase [bacterium]|nr:pantetheine-phosphate adenylyltransferase [bacterium]
MRIAVYPGSFDPITNGHLDILERSLKLFDKVIVAVLVNTSKSCLFQAERRKEMISKVVGRKNHITVGSFGGLLVDYCKQVEARTIIRGLRAVSDYEYELQISSINKQLAPDLETVFLMASTQYSFLSSSIVKEIAKLGGNVSALVPKEVEIALKMEFSKNS